MKNFDMPTQTTTNPHATTTTTDNNNSRRRGRSSTPKRRVDEQHNNNRQRDASSKQQHNMTTATTTTTITTTTDGLCAKYFSCVAGKPLPFSKAVAQDFPGAESSARTSWSCPPDDATPPDESQIGEACREKAHDDVDCDFCGLSLVVGEGKLVVGSSSDKPKCVFRRIFSTQCVVG